MNMPLIIRNLSLMGFSLWASSTIAEEYSGIVSIERIRTHSIGTNHYRYPSNYSMRAFVIVSPEPLCSQRLLEYLRLGL